MHGAKKGSWGGVAGQPREVHRRRLDCYPRDILNSAELVAGALGRASRNLIDREALVELVALAAIAREHVLVVGPPGTAKSEAVRRVAKALGGRYFEYLLGRFTEPNEIFGPVDLRKLREGVVETETTGMLPEAEIAFLDEVFLGSTAILNTLLGLLNERRFVRGHTAIDVPLRVCVGATNALPDDESLDAFADRFLVRFFVDGIPDPSIEDLLESGWALESQSIEGIEMAHVDALAETARAADLSGVRSEIAHAIRALRKNGIVLSDRRAVKLQRLVAAAAALDGRTTPTTADLWPIVYAVPSLAGQQIARDAIAELLEASKSSALAAAAEHASLGPLARAERIARDGQQLLDARPEDPKEREGWLLKLEGVAREIDAAFAPDAMPDAVAKVRTAIVEEVAPAIDLP